MENARGATAPSTSVHDWKPVTFDRFATLIHHYSTAVADRYGHDALSTTAMILSPDATATIWYRKQDRDSPVSSPALMTMIGPAGKTLCFESTNEKFVLEPTSAAEAIASFSHWQTQNRLTTLSRVAGRARNSTGDTVVIAARETDFQEVYGALGGVAGVPMPGFRFVLVTDIGRIDPKGVTGIWLHNFEHVGGAARNSIMHAIADIMKGSGWLGFTGDRPKGWASPEGLPKDYA